MRDKANFLGRRIIGLIVFGIIGIILFPFAARMVSGNIGGVGINVWVMMLGSVVTG